MAITIKQHDKQWRIKIIEEWEINNHNSFKEVLDYLIELKKTFGDLR